MNRKFLPASVLTAVLFAAGAMAPVQAGHATSHAHGQIDHFMAHHGFMKHHKRQGDRPKLGVAITEVTQGDLDRLSLEFGVRVEKVKEGSIAAAAGIRPGDLLTAINDRPAYSPERLQHLVSQARGATTVTVSRNGESVTLEAGFAEPQAAGNAMLGVRIQGMTDELREVFGSEDDTGVLISQVVAGSAAKHAGLKAGDVIVSVGKETITSVHDVIAALGEYSPGDSLDIVFVRDREKQTMPIELGGGASHSHHAYAMPHPHGIHGYENRGHGKHGHGFHGHHGVMPRHGCGMRKSRLQS